MTAQLPIRIPTDTQPDELDRQAEAALARFKAQWPPERCRNLRDGICGTPEEQAEAEARIVARALERRADDTPADEAVRKLVKGQRAFRSAGL